MARQPRPSKRQLEIQLAKLQIVDKPDLKLEQYPVSPEVAAELLYMAGFEHDDLKGRVIDLGTGTGRLAIGAVLMGAGHVVGVDTDSNSLALARRNAEVARVEIDWVESEVDKISGLYDTVIMNPPYGTRTIHADTRFLDRAFQLSPVTYSIHKSSTRGFLKEYVQQSGRRIDVARRMMLKIPHMFRFHTRRWASVEVDLCRIL